MGTVSYASTGAWADHAQVTLTGTEDRGPVYVDGTGFYTFIDLSPGNYTITATKSGYTSAVATANVTVGAVTGNMYVRDLQLGGGGPRFSDVASSNVTGTGASITWNTNTAADSKVEYGTSLSYGSSSPLDATLVTSHTVNLSGLASNTLYHYRIVSSNAGGSTYSADYTFMTEAAPEISLVRVENISCDSATIAWMTFPGGTSQVDYGLTSSYGNQTPLDSNIVTTHYVTLTGLTHSTQYHYRVTSGNDVGTDVSTDMVFTTLAPPVLSNVQAGTITSTGATITWTTDLPSSSQVSYGLTAGYGSQTPLDSALVTSHTVLITGLQPNTPYHYAAVSGNCAGTTQATDRTFTTLAPPPVISDVQAGNITNSTATITWSTDVAATSQVEYGTTTSYGQTTALDSNMVTSHSVNLTGLSIGTLYHYRVISSAAGGPSTSGDFTFTTDSNMSIPVVSNVESGNWGAATSSNLNVRITWTTDIPADSFVEYGLTTSYDMSSEVEPEMVTSHSITLSPLNPNTLYHYRVRSGNGIGGYGYSDDATFRSPIVIDNVDSGCTKTGTWSTGSQSAVPKVGSNYQYTPNSGNPAAPPTATCRWTANLTLSGFYDVYVGYQIGGNRTLAAPYTIAYIGGQTAATAISQNGPSNTFAWTRVGTNLPFAAGTGGYVEVGNNSTDTSTSRLVSADAAMFLYVGSDTTPPTVPAGVQAAAVSTNSIQLTWAASMDDFLVAGYKIYRDGVYVGSSATTTYTDTDLTPNTSYSYEIAAYDGVPLESARSAPLGFVLFVFDTSGDGKLNEADLTDFLPCAAAGANVAYPIGGGIDCSRFNTDADVDVDVDDFGVFQRCMNGTAGINLTCLE